MPEAPSPADDDLVNQIRQGDESAWQRFIDQFEGRLMAYVVSRLRNRATAEDVVQETFVGFLTSLPNFDGKRPLESYLFSICGYKLTDHLRREGRRPALSMNSAVSSSQALQLPGSARGASTIYRSVVRRSNEEKKVIDAISQQIDRWKSQGNWVKLQAIELLIVRGMPNKKVAESLGLTEQQVANYKSDFQIRMKSIVGE
ncbi:MAG: sigma-70 family RNA polymerase sigma factor [Planctomycetota bacterium]